MSRVGGGTRKKQAVSRVKNLMRITRNVCDFVKMDTAVVEEAVAGRSFPLRDMTSECQAEDLCMKSMHVSGLYCG